MNRIRLRKIVNALTDRNYSQNVGLSEVFGWMTGAKRGLRRVHELSRMFWMGFCRG